jgi:hypothetical protein
MVSQPNAESRCRLIGEYIDQIGPPAGEGAHIGQVVRPRLVAEYNDTAAPVEAQQPFTVLLRDKRVLTVPGHSVECRPNAGNGSDYAVVTHHSGRDVTVALFPAQEVTGIFRGQMQVAGEQRP